MRGSYRPGPHEFSTSRSALGTAGDSADFLKELIFQGADPDIWSTVVRPITPLPVEIDPEAAPEWEMALDTALDLKWRFYESGALSFALKPGVTLPTGEEDQGRGSGEATWGALVIASYELQRWAFHGHAGYRRNRNRLAERESLWQLAGALWFEATPALDLIVDVSFDRNPDPGSSRELRQTVLGVIYGVAQDVDLDAGIRRGNDPAIDRALLFGVTLRW